MVDQALARLHDARAQVQVLDKEFVGAVTRDLSPQKKARAVLFLGKFHARMMRHGPMDGRAGPHGPGHGPGRGMGPGAGGVERMPPGSGGELGLLEEPPEDDEL
jgi:hypothetical protein